MDERSPPQKHLFLSDVHLGGFAEHVNRWIEQSLIRLLDYCQTNQIKMYVLGDLFDYWMEYPRHHPELGGALRERFKAYNRHLGPTLYITGNHDNWTRTYFSEIGFDVEREYRVISLDGERVLLLHGDGTIDSKGRIRRPLPHRLLRNSRFVRLFQTLFPPETGLSIMKRFSQLNRFWGEKRGTEPSKLNKWAERTLKETQTGIIICGHDHEPRILNFPFGTYLNSGNFYIDQTVVIYNNNGFELVFWDDGERQLKTFQTPNPTDGKTDSL